MPRLTTLRDQFKSSTIRAQIVADGVFHHELTTPNPYRNTLFNLDMLAGCACFYLRGLKGFGIMSCRMGRGCAPSLPVYPFILDRGTWPYRADAKYFNDLPFGGLVCCLRRGLTIGRSMRRFGKIEGGHDVRLAAHFSYSSAASVGHSSEALSCWILKFFSLWWKCRFSGGFGNFEGRFDGFWW